MPDEIPSKEDNKIDDEVKRFMNTSRAFYLNVPVAVFEILGWDTKKLYHRRFKIKEDKEGIKELHIIVRPSKDDP